MIIELGSSDLNFNDESTMLIFNHLALHAGPTESNKTVYRDAHIIFKAGACCNRLRTQIQRMLMSIKNNWRETKCMELLVTLALRLYASSSDKSSALQLLDESRNITLGWFTRLRADERSVWDSATSKTVALYAPRAALLYRGYYLTAG